MSSIENKSLELRKEYLRLADEISDINFNAIKELEKVQYEIQKIKEEQTNKKSLIFLTADPKNTNPIRALQQKQIIEDTINEKYDFINNTQTKYNQICDFIKNSHFIHITVHGRNQSLIFEHDEKKDEESPVNIEYLCHQFKKSEGQKKIVVLMACKSKDMAKALVDQKLTEFAIGTTIDISGDAAVAFTKQFYKDLVHFDGIQEAFQNTCFELNQNPYRVLHDDSSMYDFSKIFVLFSCI